MFQGRGNMLVERGTCYEWFGGFVDTADGSGGIGDGGWCTAGSAGKLVVGGRRNVFEGSVRGMAVWAETRKRADDGFVVPPEEGEGG